MRENPNVDLVGIYEGNPEDRARAAGATAYAGLHWYGDATEMLGDASIDAIAIEGRNHESLATAIAAVKAGKHIWYDKPAGDDWGDYLTLASAARDGKRLIQMGYMLRYHDAFRQAADWARDGVLGHVFGVRAHMSTYIPVTTEARLNTRSTIARHRGGIFYDLGGHMLDQVVWILGRPRSVTAFLRNDTTPDLPMFADNTLGVFEYERALATVDIAAMEPRPMARRFEVYGTAGSAILVEPFEPGGRVRLVVSADVPGYKAGEHMVDAGGPDSQSLYDRELVAFVATVRGEQAPDRSLDHEFTVQETLLRATGGVPSNA
jgi:predicted dehydrogenase